MGVVVMKRIKKFLYYSTTFIILLLSIYSLFSISKDKYHLYEYNKINKVVKKEEIESITPSSNESTNVTKTSLTYNTLDSLDDYRNYYNNDEIVGILSIDNTNFSQILVQASDNKYYLNHLVNKQKNKLGSTFVDYRTDLNNSKKINIYGHNNGNKSNSFNILTKYLDKSYYENHKLIKIKTDNNLDTYEIFSVEIVDNNKHMQIGFSDIEWVLYIESIIDNSIYETNTSYNDITKMITLQTCTNNNDNSYLLIHGRKI
jgi:sortase B